MVEPLYSTLGDDPDLASIVDLFVEEMPNRVQKLLACMENGNWEQMRSLAHQLKGAAGSYGFSPITASAGSLEQRLRDSQPEERICEALDELVKMCQRVRSAR